MTPYRLVITTVPTIQEGRDLARKIVEERLAACVTLLPQGESFYIWEGELQEDREYLLLIKTAGHLLPALEKRVQELHSYDLPEFISLAIDEGSDGYLEWIGEMVR
ncbi:MAG: divalent-cation tolerance protein CutA [Epsilonproteobacteria bacterium]|nr:divalent-cation tolerance protein CutA [Campylobacterota bacterium]NPA57065.1 divalent-cation tolerance protein CutA [Campylobacterota bacterium]